MGKQSCLPSTDLASFEHSKSDQFSTSNNLTYFTPRSDLIINCCSTLLLLMLDLVTYFLQHFTLEM